MGKLKLIFVFLLSVLVPSTAYNKNCNDFLKTKIFIMTKSGNFLPYGQSRGESFKVRKTYSFEIVFFGKKEYVVGIATEDAYEPVHIRMVDKKYKKVLYDNNRYQYKGSFDFCVEKTQTISIEVTIIASEEQNLLPEDLRVCLGIKIFSQTIDYM